MKNKVLFIILVALVLICITTFTKEDYIFTKNNSLNFLNETNQIEQVKFPLEIEKGAIVLESLFQSSISNPDNNDKIGENIASLELVNKSSKYISKIKLKLTLSDKQNLYFEATDIPAYKKIWFFDLKNTVLKDGVVCTDFSYDVEYLSGNQLLNDNVHISATETIVEVKNMTDEELKKLRIKFHCLFDDVYFGGKTYTYSIENLKVNETKTVDVVECYLGTAEAVLVVEEK